MSTFRPPAPSRVPAVLLAVGCRHRVVPVLAHCLGIALLGAGLALPATADTRTFHLALTPPRGVQRFGWDSTLDSSRNSFGNPFDETEPGADDAAEDPYGLQSLSPTAPLAAASTVHGTTEPEGQGQGALPGLEPLHRFGPRLAYDVRDLFTAPARMSRRDWAKVGVGTLIVGAVSLADDRVRDFALRPGQAAEDTVIGAERPLANGAGLVLLGASWLAGHGLHRRGLKTVAADGLEASLIAAGLITPALKQIFGRDRPREDLGPHSFGGGHSFPSGETTQAFALASVVSAHYHQRWVGALSWSLAGVTAWGRIRDDGHWASDVVAGAFIGAGVGRWIVHRNRPELRPEGKTRRHWSIAPEVVADGQGLAFRMAW